ncbi:leucine-rich melanocyte differentiation-associated protein [Trichonephila inaurata madagascariensis]|uniref:Leucine-rich melanocyte differentiation-associated protein n=1 Tax=Trichonephila inaurata madagascariensis TaxID=2747483 RepID=A0A8X6Y7F1_9ARAC|nr:leucine-rich melanocyte differentiation-associated protein [Trichonephila inaurata madagascariensis]
MEETSEDGDNSSVSDSYSLGSVGSGNNSLDEYPDRKFSHVCILTYWTKDRVVCGVDLSYIGQDCYAIPSILALSDNLKFGKDEEDYPKYRYYIIHQIPKLKFLDSTPVKPSEKSEAKRIGVYMKVARPKVEVAHEASDDATDSRYSPLPPNHQKEGTHRGSFGKLRQRYTGTQSEGNRFIRDNEL